MKFIRTKTINNQEYFYIEFQVNLQGKRTIFAKSLGKSIPNNLKAEMSRFFEKVATRVSSEIKESYFPANSVKHIEQARFNYIQLSHRLFTGERRVFKKLFLILFVLNSNRAEGSKVTQPNIEQVLSKRSLPKTAIEKEIVNSINAINFAFSKNMKWNQKSVKEVHKLLFHNVHPEIAGKYKKIENVVANQKTTSPKQVREEMRTLLEWFNQQKREMYPPQLALEFHWRFEAIHPFEDGNGRVGRILLNSFLLSQGYAPVVFFSENHTRYCNAISKARDGSSSQLAKHYIQSVKKTKVALEKYEKEGAIQGGDSKIGKWEISRGKIRVG